ncbi:PREDICTED: DNA mismatch repair protein Mlh1 isoform X2 [Dinoponera quadriceps]|uniref:DNA mismatch repair protein Mlh1 isoform X2 n=1 Tax=Dinoponera quadriceps TaxID=609295 RepID=A0A6P3XB33_DINQU|nr:PREDICTED: DNA mismatch repair protein Mlh1 isoform X2 [Dinoponera quadriceps]
MCTAAKIRKLDEVVVNRIAAGEVIQRPANALKELIENSLDAKATNIQITAKEGGLKLLQIQDNGTGIRKEDMEIVCERFTTSKLQKFEDLGTLTTFGFRGEALASISHVALLSIITRTADEKCAYMATYLNSKLKAPPAPCAGNQGTIIKIENLFYNVATRRKALSSSSEEFTKITEVVMRYAVHNPTVGFTLKKFGETSPQVRTPHNSTKQSNIRILYGNPVARELLEIELNDETYRFKMHALVTNPNHTNKRMVMLLFINNRLVDSSSIRKMLEEVYTVYLPKKAYPWCYISLEINSQNIDVNVHPTKHEVRFLHEDAIIERIKLALDERLTGSSASKTFYLQARLPKADITKDVLKEVLPEYNKGNPDKSKKVYARELIRTDSSDQKLDKFNFTIHSAFKHGKSDDSVIEKSIHNLELQPLNSEVPPKTNIPNIMKENLFADEKCQKKKDEPNSNSTFTEQNSASLDIEKTPLNQTTTNWCDIIDNITQSETQNTCNPSATIQNIESKNTCPEDAMDISEILSDLNETTNNSVDDVAVDTIADKARKQVYRYFGNLDTNDRKKNLEEQEKRITENTDNKEEGECSAFRVNQPQDTSPTESISNNIDESEKSERLFKSYSINSFRHDVKLTSILQLRKEIEDECHEGLREILSNLTFVGCINQTSALIQSGVNLYICNTKKLAEELFYEIMLYDFANFGIFKFSIQGTLDGRRKMDQKKN